MRTHRIEWINTKLIPTETKLDVGNGNWEYAAAAIKRLVADRLTDCGEPTANLINKRNQNKGEFTPLCKGRNWHNDYNTIIPVHQLNQSYEETCPSSWKRQIYWRRTHLLELSLVRLTIIIILTRVIQPFTVIQYKQARPIAYTQGHLHMDQHGPWPGAEIFRMRICIVSFQDLNRPIDAYDTSF